ncbi:hypothetical protein EON65_31290 [archaeon]|nr:MAG: hypothetical protein EON65_31290 [archaeon]
MYPRPVGFLTLIDLYKQSLAQHKPAIQLLHDMTLVYKDRVKGHRTTHNSFIQGIDMGMSMGIDMSIGIGMDMAIGFLFFVFIIAQ